MFCVEAPLECEKHLSESFLSDSVKSLNEDTNGGRALCQSDSNIPATCAMSPWKKRQRSRTKPPLRGQTSLSLKIRNRSQKENTFERGIKRSKDAAPRLVSSSPEKKANVTLEQVEDIDYMDGCKGSGEEIVQDCSRESAGESENEKSENRCLQNKTSINNKKAIDNNSVKDVRREVSIEENGIVLHLNGDFHWSDNVKPASKSLKRQKINSGSSFLSLCSLFSLSKSSIKTPQVSAESAVLHQKLPSATLSCCSLTSRKLNSEEEQQPSTQHISNIIISQSPKPENRSLFPDVRSTTGGSSFSYKGASFSSDSSSADTSSDGVAPIASPEFISPADSLYSSPRVMVSPESGSLRERCPKDSAAATGCVAPLGRLKLLHEGDAQVCYLSHTRTIFRKVLSSKLLRRWETHHIYLTEDCLCSKTSSGFLESPIPYSNLDEVYVVGRWDHRNRFCIRLVMADGSLLLQTSNSLVRDQWLSSILWKKNMHKYKNILRMSTRPEVILKEIKGMIYSSLNSPLKDDCIRSVPIEIISKVLSEEELWSDRERSEEVIVALAPLLEDSTPSAEMFRFFSRHCLSHPRSPVVVDVFTSVVQRILKRTLDFGKSPLMRRFVADYFKALYSQNDGQEAIRKFITSVHGTSFGCPHPRVLPNLVAVNLAAVFSHFEQRKTLLTESANETNCNEALQLLDKQLECFVTLFLAISEYEDWRCGLAQLLQPIPFPDDALSHHAFIKEFIPVMRQIGTDPRCEVHETVLGIRENKEGWLSVFCPSSLVCKDEGVLWCQMLNTLFHCCCRRKSFLQKMVKHLGALLLVALRGHAVAQEMLCLMLEWRLITGEDQKMQVVTTLQSNESGRQKYGELCKRQEHLKELQKEGGPKKLTLPSRSTDADVARLLSCGSFGNLECLSLAFTHVTSACAHQLILLPALRYLNLWATQFGDAGLVIIAEHLDKLQVLNLCETPVSDKGIAAIAAMRNLKKLNLNSTKLSPQTLDTLKMKLPTLQELDVRYTDAW